MNSISGTDALGRQAETIFTGYVCGNKSWARAAFNQIPEKRKAYVALQIYKLGMEAGDAASVDRFIQSVTE